jgi:hypothetical protein
VQGLLGLGATKNGKQFWSDHKKNLENFVTVHLGIKPSLRAKRGNPGASLNILLFGVWVLPATKISKMDVPKFTWIASFLAMTLQKITPL